MDEELQYDVDKMVFYPKVVNHDAKDITIELNFENPDSVSIGGRVILMVEILETNIFKNAETFEEISKYQIENGKSKFFYDLPP